MDRWNQVQSITVDASITGAFWHLKGKGDALKDVRFEVDTTRERLTMDFAGQDKRSVFEPHRVVMQRRDGALIGARDDPERSFAGHQLETPWDDIHLAYFTGEALWTYLNTPFLYTWPGFATEEIAPIEAGGETWRRLKVTFPDHIKSHTRQQISCFGPDGLLRRHDFTIDILGGAAGRSSTPPATATSTASSSPPRDGPTPQRATTSSSPYGRHRHGQDHHPLTSPPGAALPDVCAFPGSH